MNIKTEISKIHYNKQTKGFFFSLLKFFSVFYGFGSRIKNIMYDKKFLIPKKIDAFVISIGNLTTGGVGKTPVVANLANYFTEKGEKTAIISRGYGGKLKGVNVISDGKDIFFDAPVCGDEPNWLAKNTNAVVITSPNRFAGAKLAVNKYGVKNIILDDGFQHRKLYRNLDIVLVDSEKMLGNECLLPAGPLREGREAFSRIDKILIVSKNTDHSKAEKYARIMSKKLKKETVMCYTEPDYAYNTNNHDEKLNEGESIVAFCAIGQPQQFYKFLSLYDIKKTIDFDDHHIYTKKDLEDLNEICKNCNAKYLITTEKDAVKLAQFKTETKIFALKLKTSFDAEKLLNL